MRKPDADRRGEMENTRTEHDGPSGLSVAIWVAVACFLWLLFFTWVSVNS